MSIKVIADNRKARFNYEILEKLEVGLVLQGSEVKALRDGRANLVDGFAQLTGAGAFLNSVHISPYSHGGYANHEPTRSRKILIHRKELDRWLGKVKSRGLTVVPLKLYFNDKGKVKCELALARGKKLYDKRESIKQKDMDRDAKVAAKNRGMA